MFDITFTEPLTCPLSHYEEEGMEILASYSRQRYMATLIAGFGIRFLTT